MTSSKDNFDSKAEIQRLKDDFEPHKYDRTPLHAASRNGYLKVVEYLK